MRRLLLFLVVILFMISITFIPSFAQTTRTVMIEEFTGTWCGWCPYGADTLTAILKAYSNVRALSFHGGSSSEPMKTPEGDQFISGIGLPGWPSAAIDRVKWPGESKIPIYREKWRNRTTERLNVSSPLSISVSGTYDIYTKKITAYIHLDILQNMAGSYNLNVVIAEDGLNYPQLKYPENIYLNPYFHDHVVRKMITGATGKQLTSSGFSSGASRDTTIIYTLAGTWVYGALHLAVMVSEQNGNTYGPHAQSYEKKMSAIFTNVPVELISFYASQRDDRSVRLTWRTASQSNNLGWEIERADNPNSWTKVGFVCGHGTTHEKMCYEFIDENVQTNIDYQYRLKQIDADGKTEYSPIARVYTFATPTAYSVEQNYPNPFNPVTTILYSLPIAEHVNIVVYDNLGRQVKTLFNGMQQAGPWEVQWNGTDESDKTVANGLYYYTVTTPNFKTSKRMMLVK